MIPVWEEDWTAAEATVMVDGYYPRGDFWDDAVDVCMSRCRLASAAPDMARLLLRLEGYYGRCVCCSNAGGHDDGCEWLAVMRKAGIRE